MLRKNLLYSIIINKCLLLLLDDSFSPLRYLFFLESEDEFCKDALQQKNVIIPPDCVQANINATTYDAGYCLPTKGCRLSDANDTDTCDDELTSCCVPSRIEFKTLNCADYDLEVIIVKACMCGVCDSGSIIIEGKAIGAKSNTPLIDGEVWLNGEFAYNTDYSGFFTVSVKKSVGRAVINVKDTYNKEYLDAIKIIDITENLSGRISTTIRMLKAPVPVVVDSSIDAIIQTSPGQNASENDMAEVFIPANSFYTKEGDKYSGNVTYKVTFIDPVDTDAEEIPGEFEFIDEEGSKVPLATRGLLNINITGESGQELIVDDLIDVSFPSNNDQNMTLWILDEASGIWKQLIVGTESKRRKRRRTQRMIGEIDMSQIRRNTWLNIDRARKLDNLCYFKIRVYVDENLSEELTSRTWFRMELHTVKNRIMTTYKMYMVGSGTTCFPVACENDIAYIRFFFSKVTLWDSERDLYAVDIASFPLSN